MFKCNKLLGVSLAAVMSISATATNVFAIDTSVIDEKWGETNRCIWWWFK